MLTERTIKIPIYGYYLKIVVFDSDNRQELISKYPMVKDSYYGCTVEYPGNRSTVIVPINDLVTAVHESEHIKNIVWKFIGYPPHDAEYDEVDAYLVAYIFSKIKEVMNKHLASKC